MLFAARTSEKTAMRLVTQPEDRTQRQSVIMVRAIQRFASSAWSRLLDCHLAQSTRDGQWVAGQPNNYFICYADMSSHGLVVAYIENERAPIVTPYPLTEGRIGQGVSVHHALGIAPAGRSEVRKLNVTQSETSVTVHHTL